MAYGLGFAVVLVGLERLAQPAAALLLHAGAILLSVALLAGVIAFAAFRIGIAPSLR